MTVKVALATTMSSLYVAIGLSTFSAWPGSIPSLATFHITMAAMISLIFIGPVSYAYGFWATFLFLGFWPKLAAHLLWGLEFIEPIGAFDGSAQHWDTALLAVAAAVLGVVLIRLLQLFFHERWGRKSDDVIPRTAPLFYQRRRYWIWVATLVVILALNFWNLSAAFYQIGINPRVILPARMNVGMAWLLNWGFAMWVACLVHWELRIRPSASTGLLLAIAAEALIASASTLSRSAYLLHALPGLLAWRLSQVRRETLRRGAMLVLIFMLGLFASLAIVQAVRSQSYFTPQPSTSIPSTTAEPHATPRPPGMFTQIAFLFLHRWVGLEGMLAVTAYPEKKPALLQEALSENPKLGANTIFQRIAKSAYGDSQNFTFLTLAGVSALLFYSGSELLVIVGMALLTLVLIATETVIRKATSNHYLVAVAAVAMAYTTAQMNFPYLTLVFFLQLWATIVVIAMLEHIGSCQSQIT